MTTPGMIANATAKSGVETFTRYLAKELGPGKIRVNVVALRVELSGGQAL